MSLGVQKATAFILSLFTLLFNGKLFGKDGQYLFRFDSDVKFETVNADEMKTSENEKAKCREWFETNILNAGTNGNAPAYQFKLGNHAIQSDPDRWTFSTQRKNSAEPGAEAYMIIAERKDEEVTAFIDATLYPENAACEWTVTLRNDGKTDSSVISGLKALKTKLGTKNADLYCSRGSDDSAGDFTLMKERFPRLPLKLTCSDGRPTHEYLPFFNISSKDGGAVAAIGWTGLWTASFKCGGKSADVSIGQKQLKGYLEPGEEIRSPLVSLTFYEGSNPLKGFKAFRDHVKQNCMPKNAPTVQNNMDVLFVSSTRTAAEIINDLDHFDKSLAPYIDNLWMDAGWYSGCETDWADGVGNWMTSPERFPNGIKEISDKAKTLDSGLLLWYEPERLTNKSYLYSVAKDKEGWIVDLEPKADFNERVMWNLGNKDACDFLTDFISDTLSENGVSVYRQDFNFSPAPHWKYADKHFYDGRKGFAENHYIQGLYFYLDQLLERHPGLLIDNCSSGGKRLDLEMVKRGVPMWRSDYNCDQTRKDLLEATQAHTYSLSFWLPISGTFINFDSEYGLRSSIINILQVPLSITKEALTDYAEERAMMMKDFYPIDFGATDPKKVTAMQYGDETEGCALIYKHSEAGSGRYQLRFNGLNEDISYIVTDRDHPEMQAEISGEKLMSGEYSIEFPDGKKAFVIRYEAI